MSIKKITTVSTFALAALLVLTPAAYAEKDPCAINQRKLDKAKSSQQRANTRKDNLVTKRQQQNEKWDRGKVKKRDKTLSARTKNYSRYSPDCFDAGTPPTVTETPTHTDDSSSKCAGARNKEAKLFAKQTKNEESTFPGTKFDKKEERLDKNIAKLQTRIDELEDFITNNCGG